MLEVGLFRNLRFTAASGSIAVGFFALAGFTFLVTQYFQFVSGRTALGTGVRILPVATSIAIAAVLWTRLAVGIGNKAVVTSGLLLFGAALLRLHPGDGGACCMWPSEKGLVFTG